MDPFNIVKADVQESVRRPPPLPQLTRKFLTSWPTSEAHELRPEELE